MYASSFLKPGLFLSTFLVLTTAFLLLSGCGGEQREQGQADSRTPATVSDKFMDNLRQQCGNAYNGELTEEPEGDEMLEGDEQLVAHFVECDPDEDEVAIAFHIETEPGEWDRSRTWIFERTPRGLAIVHDHREEDGTPAQNTLYGGVMRGEVDASENRIEFISVDRTEESGIARGWRVLIEPGERYVYGTFRGQDWSWRVDFDLSETTETPPPAWGQEDDEADA